MQYVLHFFLQFFIIGCGTGYAYHSGAMIDDKATADNAETCLEQCNVAASCHFWDYIPGYCRLRSNDGSGKEIAESFTYGAKNCVFSMFSPTI